MNFDQHHMYQWLSELRRYLHMHPETAFQETRATARLQEILSGLGIENQIPQGMETGLVGLLHGGSEGETVGLRADMDALPMEEYNQTPYASTIPGNMHACGHDAHTTIMAGVAKNLVESGLARELKGKVKFLFQPAEERVAGARAMIEAGVLENPPLDHVLACHMWPDLPVGMAGFYKGPSHAATDRFTLTINGKGTHGASPHQGIDPILAGAHFVTAVQSVISRNLDPVDAGVISVGKFHAGSASNVIPDSARLEATVRSFKPEVRQQIKERLGELAQGLEKSFGVSVEYEFITGVPPCVSDEKMSQVLYEASAEVLGEENLVWLEPKTGGEDFALFTQRVQGAIMRLGCSNQAKGITYPLHSPHFDIDEAVLPIGVEIFSRAVRSLLS